MFLTEILHGYYEEQKVSTMDRKVKKYLVSCHLTLSAVQTGANHTYQNKLPQFLFAQNFAHINFYSF